MRNHLLLLFIFWSYLCESQGWRSRITLPGSLDHITKAIFPIGQNKYLATGYSLELVDGHQVNRLVVMGLDSIGNLEWVKKYGDSTLFYLSNAFISRAFYLQSQHIYYAGCVRDSTNKQIGVLTKIAFNGDTVWQRIYRDPDPNEDVIPQMVTGSVDGGFLITGFFQHWSQHYSKCLLIKTDVNGNELWRKKIGKVAPDVQDGRAIVQDSTSGKIIIGGYQYSGANSEVKDNIVVLDSLGELVYHSAYVPGSALDLIQARNKSMVVVGGRVDDDPILDRQSYICEFDLHNPQFPSWKTVLNDTGYTGVFSAVRELPNGNFLAAQTIDSLKFTPNEYAGFVEIDATGKEVWSRQYDYKYRPGWITFELTADGGWVSAIPLVGKDENNFLFVKYDSNGCDSTLAYCELVTGLPNTLQKNLSIYPVPCDDILKIKHTAEGMSARLFSFSGVLVAEAAFGNHLEETEIDTRHLPAGVYLLQLQAGSQIINRKVLVRH